MGTLLKYLKKFIFIITSTLAGIFLFLTVVSMNLTTTVMTSDFHRGLFEKNNIYTEVQSEVSTSLQSVFTNIKSQSPQLSDQQKEIFSILQNSISPQMVKMNLNSITDGLFKYLNGEKSFLPDISIDTNSPSSQNTASEPVDNTEPNHVLSKIKRISLNAILLSANRSDILDKLIMIKLIYFVMSFVPDFSILVLVLLFLTALIFSKKLKDMSKWLSTSLLICSILNILTATAVLVYSYKILPGSIYKLTVLIPMKSEVVLSYVQDCLLPLSLFCIAMSVLMVLLAFGVLSFNGIAEKIMLNSRLFKLKFLKKHKKILEYGTIALIFVFVFSAFSFKVYSFKKDFDSNNFSNVISKLTNTNAFTQIISAKDDTIYTLQIKLVDVKNNSPVSGIQISISGKTESPEKYYNVAGITDEMGSAKFTLGKGTFHLIFSPVSGSTDYILPSPFFFDLKSVGTTIVTVNLDKYKIVSKGLGIAEIEVLDEDNLPVEGIELSIEGVKHIVDPTEQPSQEIAPSSEENREDQKIPHRFFSITNEEGIAVFKLPSGSYNVVPTDKFPEGYKIPESFEINCSPDLTTRYTIRLVKNP